MPYFSIETNKSIEEPVRMTTIKEASAFISKLLGKPESYVMVKVMPDMPLAFAGTTERTAFVQLKSIGLPADRCDEFAAKICDFIDERLRIPRDRVFIEFKDLERKLFALNGKTL